MDEYAAAITRRKIFSNFNRRDTHVLFVAGASFRIFGMIFTSRSKYGKAHYRVLDLPLTHEYLIVATRQIYD